MSARGLLVLLLAAGLLAGCAGGADDPRSPATERAARRAYDGAPPVAPHDDFGITCTDCHNERGMEVQDLGFAPASPHENTMGLSNRARCRQCHVFAQTDDLWVETGFEGLPQDLVPGDRLNPLAPPRIPHPVFMRENCAACHIGPGAREPIETTHPERTRCRQCHVPTTTGETFESVHGEGLVDGSR